MNALCATFFIHDWGVQHLQQHWTGETYVAQLPADRWVYHVLKWHLGVARKIRRPRSRWNTKIEKFGTSRGSGQSRVAAADEPEWCSLMEKNVSFCF